MARDLVPIKVKIGLRPNGHADHPDWTQIPFIGNDSEVHQHAPSSWIYDKACGHDDERTGGTQWDSPAGQQWGVMLCTRQFADAAKAAFPDTITGLTEAEFIDYWDNVARTGQPDERIDTDYLSGLKAQLDLTKALSRPAAEITVIKARIAKALDPNNDTRGVRKNHDKKWADAKVKRGWTIETP